MNDTKPALASSGIWGSILAIVPLVDQAIATFNVVPTGFINDAAGVVVGLFGAILALRGRLKASKQIKGII